ncbi:MAG: hypothetical protein ACO3FI_06110 [Cyclobacteriaceae bacterium]
MRALRHLRKGLIFSYLPVYAGELLIIFLGITLSWWFEEWRQDKQDRRRESLHLSNLHSNLETDSATISIELSDMKESLRRLKALEKSIDTGTTDSLGHYVRSMILVAEFHPNDSEFEVIKSTGEIGLILEDTLRRDIMTLYEVVYGQIAFRIELNHQAVITNNWDYAVKNFDLSKVIRAGHESEMKFNLKTAEDKMVLKNKIGLSMLILNVTIRRFEEGIRKISEVRSRISRRLSGISANL